MGNLRAEFVTTKPEKVEPEMFAEYNEFNSLLGRVPPSSIRNCQTRSRISAAVKIDPKRAKTEAEADICS